MELGAIFLLLAVIVVAGLFISRPFFINPLPTRSTRSGYNPAGNTLESDSQRSHLLAEYDRLLNGLQELEFDHMLNKIPEEEYPLQRRALLVSGSDVLRQLDALQESVENTEHQAVEARIEAAVAARVATRRPASGQPGGNGSATRSAPTTSGVSSAILPAGHADEADDEALEAVIAARRRSRQEKASGFCPRCGKPTLVSDRFCPRCGIALDSKDSK